MSGRATVIYVAYGVAGIDTSWIDASDDVVVVHNDRTLAQHAVGHPNTRHIISQSNVGFGAAINIALRIVETPRVILCNPDARLTSAHYRELVSGGLDDVVTVPLNDESGQPTWVVLPYPGALASLAMAYRLGRVLGRESRLRRLASRLLLSHGGFYNSLLGVPSGYWSLQTHWVSGAVMAMDISRLRAVGGFDQRYFMYMEDVDLCQRLAARFPSMRVRVAECSPGCHSVGGSASGPAVAMAELHRLRSLRSYCSGQHGAAWRLVLAMSRPRELWLEAITHTRRTVGGRRGTS